MNSVMKLITSKRFIGALIGFGIGIVVKIIFDLIIIGSNFSYFMFASDHGATIVVFIVLFGLLGAYIADGLEQ